jgi:hypothetical protein
MRRATVSGLTVLLWACTSATTSEPGLALTITPRVVVAGEPVQIWAVATSADGTIGQGNVTVTMSAGGLADGGVSVPLDSYGTAHLEVTCDPTVYAECQSNVKIEVTWTPASGPAASALARLNATGSGVPVTSGGGSGGGFGSSRAYLLGTLHPGTCGLDAIAPITAPQTIQVGFPCNIREGSAVLAAGGLYYSVSSNDCQVYRFVPDQFTAGDAGQVYPVTPESNDRVTSLGHCAPSDHPPFRVWPDTGKVVYQSLSMGFYEAPGEVALPWSTMPMALGSGGIALAFAPSQNLQLIDRSGRVTGVDAGTFEPQRAVWSGSSFLVQGRQDAQPTLFEVKTNGTFTKKGTYAEDWPGEMDASGTKFRFDPPPGSLLDTIVSQAPDGTASKVVYSEASKPTGANPWVGASTFTTSNFYVLISTNSDIVTGNN